VSAIGFRAGQCVRFSSLAMPWDGHAGTVAQAPTGGASRRDDLRVFVQWDGASRPQWSSQAAVVDEELYLAFRGRPLGELPWLGYAGPVQRWALTAPLQRRLSGTGRG
jgi:hypothetical protein